MKKVLKATYILKNIKFINNSTISKVFQIMIIKNQYIINNNKINFNLKT